MQCERGDVLEELLLSSEPHQAEQWALLSGQRGRQQLEFGRRHRLVHSSYLMLITAWPCSRPWARYHPAARTPWAGAVVCVWRDAHHRAGAHGGAAGTEKTWRGRRGSRCVFLKVDWSLKDAFALILPLNSQAGVSFGAVGMLTSLLQICTLACYLRSPLAASSSLAWSVYCTHILD